MTLVLFFTVAYADQNNNGQGEKTKDEVSSASIKPSEILVVDINQKDSLVGARWIVSNETSTKYYTIERTTDGVDYEIVKSIKANNTDGQHNYFITDDHPLHGVQYYRLSQTLMDNTVQFYDLNPIDFTSKRKSDDPYADEITILVKDKAGRESFSKVFILGFKNFQIEAIDQSGKLEAGTYTVTASSITELTNLSIKILE